MVEDKEELLNLLNSYGNQFMASFDTSIFSGKRKDGPDAGPSSVRKKAKLAEAIVADVELEEEWTGFGATSSEGSGSDEDENSISDGTSTRGTQESSSHRYDVDEAEEMQTPSGPAVIIFSEKGKSTAASPVDSKAQLKAFMVGMSL
jgi:hypothetical protein